MLLRKQTLITICILATGMFSCSQRATIPTQISYIPPSLIISDLDSLLSSSEINLSYYQPKMVEFYKPPLKINENFDKSERTIVGLSDETLFDKNQELVIDFSELKDNAFKFPLPEAKVISPYGRRHGRNHTGMDLKVSKHDTINAAFDGIVRVASTGRGYGNVIVIRHYNGLETVYAHISKFFVKSGDRINAGEPIAVTGQTGRASTDHLHFEIRVNGKHFDPNLLIDFNKQTLYHKCLVFTPGEKGNLQIEQV